MIPHVAQFDEADVTDPDQFHKDVNARAANTEARLMLAFVIKASVAAPKKFPTFNASLLPPMPPTPIRATRAKLASPLSRPAPVGERMKCIGTLRVAQAEAIIKTVAGYHGKEVVWGASSHASTGRPSCHVTAYCPRFCFFFTSFWMRRLARLSA